MFHDQLMKDGDDFEQWHYVYGRVSDALDVSLGMFLEVLQGVEKCAHATGNDIHAVTQMLMYEFAEPIDGVAILVRSGSGRNCPQLLRTSFEIGLSLRYILEDTENYERRSLAYEYYHLLDALKLAQKCDSDHPNGQQLRKELEGNEHADLFDIMDEGIDIKNEVKNREALVNSARYALVRTEIDRIKEAKKKAHRHSKPFGESSGNWFSLWGGPKDVRSLSLRLKQLAYYESFYRNWSNVTHGEGALKRILGRATDGLIQLVPLRSPINLPATCLQACQLTNGLTLAVVDKLVPRLKDRLRDWYTNHMTPALAFIMSVKIKR